MTTPKEIKEIENRIGTLSNPGKMPCFAYSLPAKECQQGKKLVKIKNSVCAGCYALKGNYRFSNVARAMQKRLESIKLESWVQDMVKLIKAKSLMPFFRWHDSGDLQSKEHLEKICEIARLMPDFSFWLPTKEVKLVLDFGLDNIPKNLVVRISHFMVDKSWNGRFKGFLTSAVSTVKDRVTCPAPMQGNKCLTCRACWDIKTECVTYAKH